MTKILSPFFAFLASFLIVDGDFENQNADLAVVLSGAFPRGTLEASKLYGEGRVDEILLLSERDPRAAEVLKEKISYELTTSIQKRILLQSGVPKEKISMTQAKADSTKEEAKLLLHFLQERKDVESIVVISRKFQSRRAKRIFSSQTFSDYEVFIRISRYDDVDPKLYWKDAWGLFEFTIESMKWIYDGITFFLPFLHYEVEEPKEADGMQRQAQWVPQFSGQSKR